MLINNFLFLGYMLPPGFKAKSDSSESEVEIIFFNSDTLDFGVFRGQFTSEHETKRICVRQERGVG